MPRSDYGGMLKGHGLNAFSTESFDFCDILNKCNTIKRFRQGAHCNKGTRKWDVMLSPSKNMPRMLVVRFQYFPIHI